MTEKLHTPTMGRIRNDFIEAWSGHFMDGEEGAAEYFDQALHLHNARIEAAAEQRGRISELREVVAEFEHQDPNDLRNNSMRDGQVWTLESCMSAHLASAPILDWLENRADQMEGDDETH